MIVTGWQANNSCRVPEGLWPDEVKINKGTPGISIAAEFHLRREDTTCGDAVFRFLIDSIGSKADQPSV